MTKAALPLVNDAITTGDVGLGGIAVLPDRLRQLRPEVVNALAESMKERGLLHPITVRPAGGGGYFLVAGRHRHAAARKLGWAAIPCRILPDETNENAARLAEIDENLQRADLSPAEHSAHMIERKRLYELLKPQTKHGGAPGAGRGKGKRRLEGSQVENFVKDTAEKTGKGNSTVARYAQRGASLGADTLSRVTRTSLDKGDELDALVQLDEPARDAVIERAAQGEKVSAKAEVKKQKRAEKEKDLALKQMALPNKQYGVIVADCEWKFEVRSENGMDRSADNHYPTSALEVIKARDVPSIVAPDCVLFLWATAPMMPQALEVMAAWGFAYKSQFVWAKDRRGTGYWNRNRHEVLLVGTHGNPPAPAPGTQWDSLIEAAVGRHSEKPERFLEMIEQYFPTLPKIELNRRGPARSGWDAWGNESEPAAPANLPPTATGELQWEERITEDEQPEYQAETAFGTYVVSPSYAGLDDEFVGYATILDVNGRFADEKKLGDRLGLNEAKALAQGHYNKRSKAADADKAKAEAVG